MLTRGSDGADLMRIAVLSVVAWASAINLIAAQSRADLLVRGGTIVTMDAAGTIVESGAVSIHGDVIRSIHRPGEPLPRARRTIDASHHIVIPGLVNTHTHAAMALLRGFADDLSLLEWLEGHVFPVERSHVDANFVYWGTLLGCIEMARGGTTTFVDMYYFEDSVARAVVECGLRGVVAGTIVGFPTPDHASPADALQASDAFVRQWSSHPTVSPSISVQSLYTTSLAVATEAHTLAKRHGVLFQIHAAEPPEENDLVRRAFGQPTIPTLESAGILDASTLLHHGVWLSDSDIALIASAGASVSHNPESNMKTASGVAPVPDLLRAGVSVGLGTDGAASNNNLDLFEEMDTAAKLHKLHRRDPTVLPAEAVFRMATRGGARALGMDDRIGSIESGKKADLVLVAVDRPGLTPMYDVYSHLVYAVKGSDVSTVIVGGRIVVESGVVRTVNWERLRAQARNLRDQVMRSLDAAELSGVR